MAGTVFKGAKIGELIAKTDTVMYRFVNRNTIVMRGQLYLGTAVIENFNDMEGKSQTMREEEAERKKALE